MQDPGGKAADRLLSSAVRPSKQLMAVAADEIKTREQFVLLDEQRLAWNWYAQRWTKRGVPTANRERTVQR